MYVCMYVCMYACIYIYIYIYMDISRGPRGFWGRLRGTGSVIAPRGTPFAYVCVYIYIYTYIHTYMYAYYVYTPHVYVHINK